MQNDYQLPTTYARTPLAAGVICRALVGSALVACLARVVVMIASA